jgi:glycosyltransferase involved in cell wall biosynthesis
MLSAAVIVSTYNKPDYLRLCLAALERQTLLPQEILVADDGSGDETARVIEEFKSQSGAKVRHVWHEDRGFRKTEILNKALLATALDYLVFIDGDCVAHPDFVREHVQSARQGHYLNGSLIRLSQQLSDCISQESIVGGEAFHAAWLVRQGRRFDRRYLRLSLPYSLRLRLNRASPTQLYWLGSNSSCFRENAMAINGFDNRFSYGFEDGDFGNRLEMIGVTALTVRWTANVLHLWHTRPWRDPEAWADNRKMMEESKELGRFRALSGVEELQQPAP